VRTRPANRTPRLRSAEVRIPDLRRGALCARYVSRAFRSLTLLRAVGDPLA
jgi:hypothetical protein